METNASLIAKKGDAIFVPAGVSHQFQNPGSQAVEAAFALRRGRLGKKLYE